MRDLSRASVKVDTFNNGFPKAPHACCFLYCYRDHIRSPLDVANGIIISPLADRFLMNASVCAASMPHSLCANHDYKRTGLMHRAA